MGRGWSGFLWWPRKDCIAAWPILRRTQRSGGGLGFGLEGAGAAGSSADQEVVRWDSRAAPVRPRSAVLNITIAVHDVGMDGGVRLDLPMKRWRGSSSWLLAA